MTTFDADSHVEESAQTWKYLDEKLARRRPIPITLEDQPALLGQNSFWLIDGTVVPRTTGKGLSLFGTPATSRHAGEKPFSTGSQDLITVMRFEICPRMIAPISRTRASSVRRLPAFLRKRPAQLRDVLVSELAGSKTPDGSILETEIPGFVP